MPFLSVPHGQIYYEDTGKGYPVLLFAPGFLSSRIERWQTNPSNPGKPQAWRDPVPVLEADFRVIALDVRNAGQSRVEIQPGDSWHSYTDDHLRLLDHLGVEHCHVMGACIGVSFALSVAEARPGCVTSLVLQNPIGLHENRTTVEGEYDDWAEKVRHWPNIRPELLPDLKTRMFGNDFLFSVTRDYLASCELPVLLMPGDDTMHPAAISADMARLARNTEVLAPWKGPDHRDAAIRRVHEFFIGHTPASFLNR